MKIQDIQAIQLLLATPKKIAIIPHRGPDGDAMGSTLALYHFLIKNNHQATVIAPNDFPNFLAWLPGSETVKIFETHAVGPLLERPGLARLVGRRVVVLAEP